MTKKEMIGVLLTKRKINIRVTKNKNIIKDDILIENIKQLNYVYIFYGLKHCKIELIKKSLTII